MNQLVQSSIPAASEWEYMKDQAKTLVASGLLPRAIRTPEAAIVIMLKGKELGIPAMHAFSHIHVIEGKPTMSAELMLTMILSKCPDARVQYVQNDGEACLIEASRKAMGKTIFGFSKSDAAGAGLMQKDNWKKYTRAMLRARATSEMARSMFPDALCGVSYTPEEIGGEVEVTESGEIIVIAEKPSEPIQIDPMKKIFPDNAAAWAWLEKRMDLYRLSGDCRYQLRDRAVGMSVGELDQLAKKISEGHHP